MDFYIPELTKKFEDGLSWVQTLTNAIPVELNMTAMLEFIALFSAFSLIIAFIGRSVFGKRSGLNHAVSSAMGILCIYVVTVLVYSFEVTELSTYLTPLPYVAFHGEELILLPFRSAEFTEICAQILSMVILAFLVNLLDSVIPKGKNVISWYLLRFLTVALAMAAHYIVTALLTQFLPGVLVTYAPVILLVILLATLILGLVSLILGFAVSTVNPILGVLTTFFFRNMVGKQLSKAVLTTIILTALFFVLESAGYAVILISEAALGAYLPLIAILLVLWYLIGHIL